MINWQKLKYEVCFSLKKINKLYKKKSTNIERCLNRTLFYNKHSKYFNKKMDITTTKNDTKQLNKVNIVTKNYSNFHLLQFK